MLYYSMDPSKYYKWLPKLAPGVDFIQISYPEGETDTTISEMRRVYASHDVVFAHVHSVGSPHTRMGLVLDLQWVCRLATLVLIRTYASLDDPSALPAILRHWKPGGRIVVINTRAINEWVSFARRWCRKGTELLAEGWDGGDRCGACSADLCLCRIEDAACENRELEEEVAYYAWRALHTDQEPNETSERK